MKPTPRRFLAAAIVLVLALITAAFLGFHRSGLKLDNVEVTGDLRPDEVHAICYIVEDKIVPSFWEVISKSGFNSLAALLHQRHSAKNVRIVRVERRTSEFVAVIGKFPGEEDSKEKYVFWKVFRNEHGWSAEDGQSIPHYDFKN